MVTEHNFYFRHLGCWVHMTFLLKALAVCLGALG